MGCLVNAQVLGTPLVIMSGQQFRAMLTLEGQLTNRDAAQLPRPLVKWSFEAPTPASVPAVMARAAHYAMAAPTGPVFVSVPLDDWRSETDAEQTSMLVSRRVAATLVVPEKFLKGVAERLVKARKPLFVMGSEVDTKSGWEAGIKLAEGCGAGVHLVSEPARISFPTNHANFLGTLGTTIARVREQLIGFDLVVVFGAPAFRYHAWTPGSYLPEGTQLIMITADPDQAARAPMGDAIVGDPSEALGVLVRLMDRKSAAPLTKAPRSNNQPSKSGGKITVGQFNDVVARVCPEGAAFTSEAPSLGSWWEKVAITRPRSFYCGAGGGLGFALPAAVGVALALKDSPVVALIGDGSANYSITGLWTAAQLKLPCTFVIVRNGVYEALKDYGKFLDTEEVPGMELPAIDFVSIATGYGMAAKRVSNADEFAKVLGSAISSRGPSLIEVEVLPADSGMFEK